MTKLTRTVPMPTERPTAVRFYRAVRSSPTLRLAVEQIIAADVAGVRRDGCRFFPNTEAQPNTAFRGGVRWTLSVEQKVHEACFDALVAWGFLRRDPDKRDRGLVVRRTIIPADEAVELMRELRSEKGYDHGVYTHCAWQWLGVDAEDVYDVLRHAEESGMIRFATGGGCTELRFLGGATA